MATISRSVTAARGLVLGGRALDCSTDILLSGPIWHRATAAPRRVRIEARDELLPQVSQFMRIESRYSSCELGGSRLEFSQAWQSITRLVTWGVAPIAMGTPNSLEIPVLGDTIGLMSWSSIPGRLVSTRACVRFLDLLNIAKCSLPDLKRAEVKKCTHNS